MSAGDHYRRLLLAMRRGRARVMTHVFLQRGVTAAVLHYYPDDAVVAIDRYDGDGSLIEVEAHDARALRAAIDARTYRAPWVRLARKLLSIV